MTTKVTLKTAERQNNGITYIFYFLPGKSKEEMIKLENRMDAIVKQDEKLRLVCPSSEKSYSYDLDHLGIFSDPREGYAGFGT